MDNVLVQEARKNAMVTLMHHKGICLESISAEYNLSVALLLKCPNRLFHTDSLYTWLS